MHIERVQRWVMSSLLTVTGFVFAGGLCVLAGADLDQAGARAGLLVIAAFVGVLTLAGVRVINEASPVSPWLVAGLLPSAIGWYWLYQR